MGRRGRRSSSRSGTCGWDSRRGGSDKLEEALHFKTTSTYILVGHDVKDYPKVPPDWYRNTEEQTHVTEGDWKYIDVKLKSGKVRQMKMGSKLGETEIKEYSKLIDEFNDTFAWSYDELKGIPREMVEHRIPLIPGAKPVRQKERRMNPQLQLLVRAELERLLKVGFIKHVEITDWVSPPCACHRHLVCLPSWLDIQYCCPLCCSRYRYRSFSRCPSHSRYRFRPRPRPEMWCGGCPLLTSHPC